MKLLRIMAVVLIVGGILGVFWATRPDFERIEGLPELGTFPESSIVVVTLDTTRADRFGCYGSKAGFTPFFDELAKKAIVFEQAQAVAPVTLPSHTSMFTGLYQPDHGVRNNGMHVLDDKFETLAEVLSAKGYATGAFVSAEVLTSKYGIAQGFDMYDDDLSRGRQAAMTVVPSRRGDLTLEAAQAWLNTVPEGKPFFMWLHLYDPHAPYSPPPQFRTLHPTDPYGGEIAFTDTLVHQLVEQLQQMGVYDKMIFTVLADHGEALGEHGEKTHGILLHQATTHVPWILKTPGITESLRVSRPISGADLAPLMANLVGVRSPNDEIVRQRLANTGAKGSNTAEVYSETTLPMFQYGWQPLRGYRIGDWQLINGTRDELFNLAEDPRELVDLAGNENLQLEELSSKLDVIVENDHTLSVDASATLRPSEREALAALGYLSTTTETRANPPDPRDLIHGHVNVEASRDMIAAGRYDEALTRIDTMLREDPENITALHLKGQTLLEMGLLDEAKVEFEKALRVDNKNTTCLAFLCQIEQRQGNLQNALKIARLGKTNEGAYGVFYAIEARILWAMKKMEQGNQVLEEGLEKFPNDAELLVTKAGRQRMEGDVDAAIANLRKAVEAEPFHRAARKTLGRYLLASGKPDEAAAALEDLLRVSPGDVDAHLSLGKLFLSRDPELAVPHLEEAVRLAPGRVDALITLGVGYIHAGRGSDGEAALRRAVAMQPDDPNIRNNLGIALSVQGHNEEAMKEFRKLTTEHPDFAEGHNNLAISLMNAGQFSEAETHARKALEINPDYMDAQMTLAEIYRHTGRFDDEARVLGRLYDSLAERKIPYSRPDDLLNRYGIALSNTGQCRKALEILTPIFEKQDQVFPRSHLAAAECFAKTGDTKQAIRHFEDAARQSQNDDVRRRAQEGLRRLSLELKSE